MYRIVPLGKVYWLRSLLGDSPKVGAASVWPVVGTYSLLERFSILRSENSNVVQDRPWPNS